MNHKWKDDQCINCGVKRVKKKWSRLMAIANHPPWDVYARGKDWFYSFNGGEGTFNRPTCEHKNLHNQNLHNEQSATIR